VSVIIAVVLSAAAGALGVIAVEIGATRRHAKAIDASLKIYEKDGVKAAAVIQTIMETSTRGAMTASAITRRRQQQAPPP
jgi:hypothetical protein